MSKKPHAGWLVLLLVGVIAGYSPLRDFLVPQVKEMWFVLVTRGMAVPAASLEIPEQGTWWWGATRSELPQSLYGIYDLDQRLEGGIKVVSFYQAWGDDSTHAFPSEAMANMHKAGFVPMITWEPWLSAFALYAGKEPDSSLNRIAQGQFDEYIRRWARQAVQHGKPFYLRLAHEPTNAQYPWTPHYGNDSVSYQKMWAHVHRIFSEEGARNVAWVWTPYGLEDAAYYPDASLVDYIAFDIFNYGGFSVQGTWLDFEVLAKLYVDKYKGFEKPLFVAETATTSAGGNKNDWIRDMLRSLKRGDLPELKGIVWFDIAAGTSPTGLPLDWSLPEQIPSP